MGRCLSAQKERKRTFHSTEICARRKQSLQFEQQQYIFYISGSPKRIWIGTYGGGLNLFQETADGKVRFVHNKNLLKGYPKDNFSKIRIIQEVNQTILIGTTEGLLTFSGNIDNPENIKFHPNVRVPDDASSLSSNDVIYIYTDSRDNTYVLTFTGGVNQVISDNLLTEHIQFKTYTKRNGLSSDLVLSMIEDPQKIFGSYRRMS